jgi:hypothetical protein
MPVRLLNPGVIGMKPDNCLRGAILISVDSNGPSTDDCPLLVFDNGRLSISNPFTLKCTSNEAVTLRTMTGCRVTDTIITQTEIIIVFEGTVYLCISLREEDFIGPEAASFAASSGEVVVFGGSS